MRKRKRGGGAGKKEGTQGRGRKQGGEEGKEGARRKE
jgi:hypothetical protein